VVLTKKKKEEWKFLVFYYQQLHVDLDWRTKKQQQLQAAKQV